MSCQAPLPMEFSRQEYWSGLPCPPPGDLPNPGIDLCLLHWQVDSLPGKPYSTTYLSPIEGVRFLSFLSEVLSLSLMSILSVHFRNWNIILVVLEASPKLSWAKLTLLLIGKWQVASQRCQHLVCWLCIQVVPVFLVLFIFLKFFLRYSWHIIFRVQDHDFIFCLCCECKPHEHSHRCHHPQHDCFFLWWERLKVTLLTFKYMLIIWN